VPAAGLATAAILALALGPGGGPAWAAEHTVGPITLSPGQITDQVGALGSARGQVQAAIDQLLRSKGIDLHVAYVSDFSGENPTTWANQTADRNGMGVDDVLLAVATSARQYAFSVDDDFTISEPAMAQVSAVAVEPSLRNSQWAAAAVGATQGLAQAASGLPVTTPTFSAPVLGSDSGTSASSSSTSNGVFWTVLGVLIVATLLIGTFLVLSRRRTRRGPVGGGTSPGGPVDLKALEARAAHLLVETDDAVKTSEQELGFAVAQFGQDAAASFTATLASAKRDVAEAFRLRGRLDLDPPPSEAEREQILAHVIDKCATANAALDGQSDAFEQLRDLQHRAPEVLGRLEAQLRRTPEQIDAAAAALGQARALYPPEALAPVAQNPEQARQLADYARAAVEDAKARLTADQGGQAALATRSAQDALGQIDQLAEAVGRRLGDLERAKAGLAAIVDEVDAEIVQGRALLEGAEPGAVRRLAGLEQEAARIKARARAGPGDPLDQLARLQALDAQLDELLLGLQTERERRAGARAMLEQALLVARSDVAAAEDFITTRRGAVGSRARTMQAEASRQLGRALSLAPADPTGALEAARQASGHARAAQQQANADLRGFGGGLGGLGGLHGGTHGGSGAAGGALGGLLGAVLGGLAVQSTSGGGIRGRRAGPVVRRPGGFHGASGTGGRRGGARRGAGGRF
jgi:hypothetical protein